MDIAKYIGQFILKNNFCYVHGLGNLELVKKPAYHDGKALQAPSFEVILTSGGSIDDSFANFIATNEQISISKAANALREFSIQARKDIQSGMEVELPGIGIFVEKQGKILFITNENFKHTPAGIPTIKNSKQLDEQKSAPIQIPATPIPNRKSNINWSMIIIIIVLFCLLGAGGYGIYYYTQLQNQAADTSSMTNEIVADTMIPAPTAPALIDSSAMRLDSSLNNIPPAPDTNLVSSYKFIIGDFPAKEKAESRYRKLKINGNKVEVVTPDSSNYFVVALIDCRFVDTVRVKDSLQKFFGYRNVSVYNK